MRLFNLWITNYDKAKARIWDDTRTMRALENQAIALVKQNQQMWMENEALKNELANLQLKLAAIVEAGK